MGSDRKEPTMTERSHEPTVAERDAATPDTATWNEKVDVDVELLGDRDHLDEVDLADESWAPGQGRPGVPNDEVLHIHADSDPVELTADELELDETTHDDLELAADEFFEGEGESDDVG
jgi:hypothetical protein